MEYLELFKLIISGLVAPILVSLVAYRFNKILKNNEKAQWTNQKIIEKRIVIYDQVVPKLNDMFCFYCYIGNWKELTPLEIVKLKRELDKTINIYSPLFSMQLKAKYDAFIKVYFKTFTGWGKDATINSLFIRRKQCVKNWDDTWNDCFSSEYIDSRRNNDRLVEQDIQDLKTNYLALMDEFRNNLEIYKTGISHSSDTPNMNFK